MTQYNSIVKALEREFPDPAIELRFTTSLELLVATLLSAQCTDDRVNRVTPHLFRKYRTAAAYAKADPAVLEGEIRSTGFFRNKARNIVRCCRTLSESHGGIVPDTMEELIKLPGIGRKTANVILGQWFGRPAIVVDTHVRRVSRRLGLTRSEDPDRIEDDLGRFFPKRLWTPTSTRLWLHGRTICKARNPQCHSCRLGLLCPSFKDTGRLDRPG